ncbi:copper chaperone PCu(A)C [Nocardia macrotermitis]|uniref:Putative lipoprotein LpqE n=1 Tax=Nocardia macrotermitis TaxID=2585198 RepID=A0A7K0CX99_9NOCA|nr:hypothetical protein [Nocardia macrotermitis]MQY18041.1 putative lipoprotein LpqE [Nocardia macrotermitis]
MTALKATSASEARRRAVRRSAVAVAALAAGAALALSGCSSGQIAQTARQVSAVNGNTADIGNVALRDVRILLPQSEQYTNAKGGKALLAFSAVNFGAAQADELSSITTDLGTIKITPAGVTLDPGRAVVAGGPGAVQVSAPATSTSSAPSSSAAASSTTAAAPTTSAAAAADGKETSGAAEPIVVEISGLTKDITPGPTYPVTFNFKNAGTVLVNVPVDGGSSPHAAG